MQAAWPEELHGLQSTPKDSQSAPYYELMIYAQRLQVTSRIRQRYANTTPAIRQCHASATPTLSQCSASAASVLRQCYAKDTPPAHKLRSVLTGYARPKGLTTYDQELTTYAIGSGFTPTKAQESRPQAHNLRSGAHRPRSCHGFIVDVQEPTDHNALLNSWLASPPTRPLRPLVWPPATSTSFLRLHEASPLASPLPQFAPGLMYHME